MDQDDYVKDMLKRVDENVKRIENLLMKHIEDNVDNQVMIKVHDQMLKDMKNYKEKSNDRKWGFFVGISIPCILSIGTAIFAALT